MEYCQTVDIQEFARLQEAQFSKETFDINYPFWLNKEDIGQTERYWSKTYDFDGESIRVCNDWYVKNTEAFKKYLIDKKIATNQELDELVAKAEERNEKKIEKRLKTNSRYRGNAIGNAQNLVIRNILSNLSDESFNENDWKETKAFFDNKCAYCGSVEHLVMEHAVPINKTMLGEHRLGNIVPSCKECNDKKASQSYDKFLKDASRLEKIEEYMRSKKYEPLGDHSKSEIIAELLEKAYRDTAEVAKRYIDIIELIQNRDTSQQ
jgi:hypothetical protein